MSMFAFGIIGIGRDIDFGHGADISILYTAGLTWLQGLNAYDPQIASQVGGGLVNAERYDFAYPPQIAPLILLLAMFPFAKVCTVMILLNLFSVITLAFFCVRLVQRGTVKELNDTSSAPKWFIPAIIIGNPFTTHILWMGQTTLIGTAAWVGSWYFSERQRWLLSGILLGFATFKPQISLLIIIWFLLERRFKVLSVAATSILFFSLYPMIVSGPVQVFLYWLDAVKGYKSQVYNTLGFSHLFGLQSVLYSVGIMLPTLFPLGTLLVLLLWRNRFRLLEDDFIGLLPAISLLMGFSHDYDLIALAPFVAVFWRHLHLDRVRSLISLLLLAFMFFPQRFLTSLNIDLLTHERELVLAGALIWLVTLSYHRARELRINVLA
ncbi:glycosyltransferase family 87 protein [Trichothermofontia sp.]